MDTKTVAVLEKLHTQVIDEKLDVAQWATLLKAQLTKEQFAIVKETMSSGTLYLRNQEYCDIATGIYPWMANAKMIDDAGKTITITPWLTKMKDQGVTRPKDILHLGRIIALIDNPAAKELFGF